MLRRGKFVHVLSNLLAALWLSISMAGTASADAATKTATSSSDKLVIMGTGGTFTTPFSTILSASIKPPQGFNDLLITVSAGTTLISVDSRLFPLGTSISIGDVGIEVMVLVDSVPVILGGDPSASVITWGDEFHGVSEFIPAGAITESELALFGVRSFTFTQPNVGPSTHLGEVQARYSFTNADFGGGSSFTEAVIGPRTLVVEAANLQ